MGMYSHHSTSGLSKHFVYFLSLCFLCENRLKDPSKSAKTRVFPESV